MLNSIEWVLYSQCQCSDDFLHVLHTFSKIPFEGGYYKLFTFLSVDMEILTPGSSQVHPEAQPKGVQATEGC